MGKIAYAHHPLEDAPAQCARIVGSPFGFSIVVTRQMGRSHPEVVGVQNAALIAPWLSEWLLEGDGVYVHNKIRDTKRSPFPTEVEVARTNAGEGLDLLLSHFSLDRSLDPAEAIRVRGLMISTFSEFYAGNKVRSILVETSDAGYGTAVAAGFQLVRTQPQGIYVLRVDLARALEVQNFHLARLLHYRPPVFGFPPLGREALRLAIQGLTDAQVTARYGITASSLASRWNRLFDIVEDVMPELFTEMKGKRSRERLPLLAYVRAHPEELWPYEPD